MKKSLITTYVLITALLSLFSATPAMADSCSGGPWKHVLLFDIPPQSAFICQDIANATDWLSSGCDAKYPGSLAVNTGSCEPASPPYEYSVYGDCECPQPQALMGNPQSKLPACSSSDASNQAAICPHLHQATLTH